MNATNNTISAEEAQATLDSLTIIKRGAVAALRPPLWFIVIVALLYGLLTYSYASMRHENLWTLGVIIAVGGIFAMTLFLLYSYRLLGVKMGLVPASRRGKLFVFAQGLFITALLVITREMSTAGMAWAAWVGAVVASLSFGLMMYLFPTGELTERGTHRE